MWNVRTSLCMILSSLINSLFSFLSLFQIRDWVCASPPWLTDAVRWKWQASTPRCSAAVIQVAVGPWVTSQRCVQSRVPVSLQDTSRVMHKKLTVGHILRKKKKKQNSNPHTNSELVTDPNQCGQCIVNALDRHFIRVTNPEIHKPSLDIPCFLNTSLAHPSASHPFGSELVRLYEPQECTGWEFAKACDRPLFLWFISVHGLHVFPSNMNHTSSTVKASSFFYASRLIHRHSRLIHMQTIVSDFELYV